jgi:hypothetical protein
VSIVKKFVLNATAEPASLQQPRLSKRNSFTSDLSPTSPSNGHLRSTSSTNPPTRHVAHESKAKSMRRQIMKIHGMIRDIEGRFLYAVSFAKSKSFHYLTHAEMVENYPNYLIGFYERHLRLETGLICPHASQRTL